MKRHLYTSLLSWKNNSKRKPLLLQVKSGLSRNLKSLRSYDHKYKPELIFRASPRNFSQAGNFINLPLYASFLVGKEGWAKPVI